MDMISYLNAIDKAQMAQPMIFRKLIQLAMAIAAKVRPPREILVYFWARILDAYPEMDEVRIALHDYILSAQKLIFPLLVIDSLSKDLAAMHVLLDDENDFIFPWLSPEIESGDICMSQKIEGIIQLWASLLWHWIAHRTSGSSKTVSLSK